MWKLRLTYRLCKWFIKLLRKKLSKFALSSVGWYLNSQGSTKNAFNCKKCYQVVNIRLLQVIIVNRVGDSRLDSLIWFLIRSLRFRGERWSCSHSASRFHNDLNCWFVSSGLHLCSPLQHGAEFDRTTSIWCMSFARNLVPKNYWWILFAKAKQKKEWVFWCKKSTKWCQFLGRDSELPT